MEQKSRYAANSTTSPKKVPIENPVFQPCVPAYEIDGTMVGILC